MDPVTLMLVIVYLGILLLPMVYNHKVYRAYGSSSKEYSRQYSINMEEAILDAKAMSNNLVILLNNIDKEELEAILEVVKSKNKARYRSAE